MLSVFITCLLAIHIVVSMLIILIVLMQKPKSEGLGAAFGGGMMEGLMGAQASNVLANATRWLGGLFFFLTLLLSILYARQSRATSHSAIQAALKAAAAAATPAASAPPFSALSGTAAFSGTGSAPGVLSGTGDLKLGIPATSPANPLMPGATLGATPAPAASPFPATPGSSSKASH
jgi:protein translocase SecG subunit